MAINSDFRLARADAIHRYAHIEKQLAALLCVLIDSEPDVGFAIFYRIVNTRARYAIISDLVKLRTDGKLSKPWAKLEKWLTKADGMRNRIIHWTESFTPQEVDPETLALSWEPSLVDGRHGLSPDNFGVSHLTHSEIVRSLEEFSDLATVIQVFRIGLRSLGEPLQWRDTLLQLHRYQNQREFLQALKVATQKGRPPPSQA